jgi:hypothetical protein
MYRILFESKGLSPLTGQHATQQKSTSKPAPSLAPPKTDRLAKTLTVVQLALAVLGLVGSLGMAALGGLKAVAWYVQAVTPAAAPAPPPVHPPRP